MQKKTAKKVLHLMFEIGAALNNSAAMVKAAEPDEEFKKYRDVVGKLMTDTLLYVINPICADFPELKPRQMYLADEVIPRSAKEYRHRGIPGPRQRRKQPRPARR